MIINQKNDAGASWRLLAPAGASKLFIPLLAKLKLGHTAIKTGCTYSPNILDGTVYLSSSRSGLLFISTLIKKKKEGRLSYATASLRMGGFKCLVTFFSFIP